MHLNTRPQFVSFALKTLTSAVASAVLLSSSAYAAGLGKLTVMSSLGQPLRAEIELTAVSNEEVGVLVAKLAPGDAFKLANIEFNPALLALQFTIEQRNGRQYVKITSSKPLNEPFVDMLLELSWNSGKLVREYTFLLDPAELRTSQSAQVSAPVDVLSQGSKGVAPGANYRPATKPEPKPAEAPAKPEPQAKPEGEVKQGVKESEYKVKSGDTLGRIAAQVKPADISLDMMLVALYRANPEAFVSNNMNRLKAGHILAVPDADSVRTTDKGEAHGVVVAHAADFNAYRSKLAGQVASAAPQKAVESKQSVSGKITAKVEEKATPANEAKDQLKLSKATTASASPTKSAGASVEDKIAKDKAMADAAKRVKELEKNVGDLEKLVTVKNKAGAEAAKAAEQASKPVEKVAEKPAEKPVVAAEKPKAPPPIKAAVKKAPATPEPGFMDMLMDNLLYVGAGAGVLLLGGLGVMFSRRRKDAAASPNTIEPSVLGAPTDQAHSLFAETGGASVDTNNSVFNSSFAPSASQLDTNEVDPVAEADVYIAYGRDAQAEEILKEALRTHPERYPVRLKLLEIYAARKDLRAFESQATDLYAMTKGSGDEWAQAAALGLGIDPLNPLYAGASSAAPAAPTAEEASQQALLNQQLDDALGAEEAMDLDLGLDSAPAAPAPAPAAAAPAPAKADDTTLDFDLGGLSFEPMGGNEPAAAPAAPAAAPAMAEPAMSFDLPPAVAPAPAAPEAMSFDMDFDAPKAPQAAAAAAPAAADTSMDFDLGDMSLDLPAAPAAEAPALELGDMSFDLPGAAPVAEAAPSLDIPDLPMSAPAAPSFDMGSIDLDLPAAATADTTALPDLGSPDVAVAETGEMSAAHMEMETKLDLAIAYQEIGDKEGARELLDEVIKGGNSEQVGKANEMRAKLA